MQSGHNRLFQRQVLFIILMIVFFVALQPFIGFSFTWLGDCNDDGTIDSTEVENAAKQYLGIQTVQVCNDEYGDGRVDIGEVQLIVNHSVLGCYAEDRYENDDTPQNATTIVLDSIQNVTIPGYGWFQTHNFHEKDDEDWIVFQAHADTSPAYILSVYDVEENCDPVIEVYDENLILLDTIDKYWLEKGEEYEFEIENDAIYYFKIKLFIHPEISQQNSGYKVKISEQSAPLPGAVYGLITPLVNGTVSTGGSGKARILPNGWYFMPLAAGNYTLQVEAEGYPTYEIEISVGSMEYIQMDVDLDSNND